MNGESLDEAVWDRGLSHKNTWNGDEIHDHVTIVVVCLPVARRDS